MHTVSSHVYKGFNPHIFGQRRPHSSSEFSPPSLSRALSAGWIKRDRSFRFHINCWAHVDWFKDIVKGQNGLTLKWKIRLGSHVKKQVGAIAVQDFPLSVPHPCIGHVCIVAMIPFRVHFNIRYVVTTLKSSKMIHRTEQIIDYTGSCVL